MTTPAPERLSPAEIVAHAVTIAPCYADVRALHGHILALEAERAALAAGVARALDEVLPIEDLLQPIQNQYRGVEQWANDIEDPGERGALDEAIARAINTAGDLYRLLNDGERRAWLAACEAAEQREKGS